MNYKTAFSFLSLTFVLTIASPLNAKSDTHESEQVYAKHGFYVEKGSNITTNYAAGACYPVNQQFTITKIDHRTFGQGDNIEVVSSNGAKIIIKNVNKHTNKTIEQIKEQMFSSTPVDLNGHSPAVLEAIKDCKVITGMTKDEVLLARGYPPSHQTPSLETNNWHYWEKRYSEGNVLFKNGKVLSVDGRVQP